MSYQKLKDYINENIELNKNNKSEKDKFQGLKTALNNIMKHNLVTEENISFRLKKDIDNLVDEYLEVLVSLNRKSLRSPKTVLRNLSSLYIEITEFSTDNLTFTETLKTAIRRKYGNNIYEEILKDYGEALKVKKEYFTYSQICIEMIECAVKSNPDLWPRVTIKNRMSVRSAAKVIVDWIRGVAKPSTRISPERISFIEDFLGLPENTLLDKIRLISRRSSELVRSHKKGGKKVVKTKSKKVNKQVVKKLNSHFLNYYNDYSAYKISRIQPKAINIPTNKLDDKSFLRRYKVRELNRYNTETFWTLGSKGICASAKKFYFNMKSFMNFCVVHKNIPEKDVTTEHLTTYTFLEELVAFTLSGKLGARIAIDIILTVVYGCARKGFLRLCGEKGERSTEDYFEELNDIVEDSSIWLNSLYPFVDKLGKGTDGGKQNIQFIVKLHINKQVKLIKEAIDYLAKKANANLLEANALISKSDNNILTGNNIGIAHSYISKAYYESMTALIFKASFVNCPRVGNWVMLKYCESPAAQNKYAQSITYLKDINRYELNIPLEGINPSDESSKVRGMKNAHGQYTVPIHITFPDFLTPFFELFLKIRKVYIETFLPLYIPKFIERVTTTIKKLESDCINGLKIEHKNIVISALKEDIYEAKNYKNNLDAFFLWLTFPNRKIENHSADEIEALLQEGSWLINKETTRKLHINESLLGIQYKMETGNAFYIIDPNLQQEGINIQAMRHLSAMVYLKLHPGAYEDVAAILNDNEEQIFQTYGPKNRTTAMKKLSDGPENI